MSSSSDDPSADLSHRIRLERSGRGWSLADLAQRSGVSKAMLSAIERGETSPTAALLVRIAAAFDLTLSALIARAEKAQGRLLRAAEQPQWRDPATGYVRRHVSPSSDSPLELIRVEMPAGQSVSFPAASYTFVRHLIWLIDGRLDFHEGSLVHEMHAGDCLELGPPTDCTFHAPGPAPAVYLVVVLRR
ncbi:helix-turn-helix domain-containing protein [Kumtagia ephedrae]|jgi:transcriptional regulator with XRE-family HTH domain|uniref:LacI family transcriptional regulator n=1 Tax=Kumtagia ephedrae TaxID=2116701 RepID=A0A2P7RR38_9HYPH|nr:XRE family transcriptional regulator [Mesorhizobium ephedrae]PSJ52688.1 LacI family transcriptional regulator [Mesorhizobium ephedrae]